MFKTTQLVTSVVKEPTRSAWLPSLLCSRTGLRVGRAVTHDRLRAMLAFHAAGPTQLCGHPSGVELLGKLGHFQLKAQHEIPRKPRGLFPCGASL